MAGVDCMALHSQQLRGHCLAAGRCPGLAQSSESAWSCPQPRTPHMQSPLSAALQVPDDTASPGPLGARAARTASGGPTMPATAGTLRLASSSAGQEGNTSGQQASASQGASSSSGVRERAGPGEGRGVLAVGPAGPQAVLVAERGSAEGSRHGRSAEAGSMARSNSRGVLQLAADGSLVEAPRQGRSSAGAAPAHAQVSMHVCTCAPV